MLKRIKSISKGYWGLVVLLMVSSWNSEPSVLLYITWVVVAGYLIWKMKGGGIGMEQKNTWGGKREGAGRKATAPDGLPRKQRQLRASDDEWEKIRLFASTLKKNPELADRMLALLNVSEPDTK